MATYASVAAAPVSIGVGFDTARYGHHVTFLRADLQPACPAFEFPESRAGYERLRHQLQRLQQQAPTVHFHIRLDAAGQYATNLETFLRQLPFPSTLTVGEPARNAHYRRALFPKRKADPVESLCAARFALLEQPTATPATAPVIYHLREIVHRLEGQIRQSTRLTNQLHNLLARVFPELAVVVADLQAAWILQLLDGYPTPTELAHAPVAVLTDLPFVTAAKAARLQAAAAASVASFSGDTAATLVRQLVRQLRESLAQESRLKELSQAASRQVPQAQLLESIPGIGAATAAVLIAKIVTMERFATPGQLVSYFGTFPQEDASGLGKDGAAKPGRHTPMSRKGNDLVRRYLWNAAKTALRWNPAIRALYQRLRARGTRGDVALGHCMRKLLHLVFAVWKTGRPFDPAHYPWEPEPPAATPPANEKTAGHNQDQRPACSVVTAADFRVTPGDAPRQSKAGAAAPAAAAAAIGGIDFVALREHVSMEQVLAELGCLSQLKGSGSQRRGPCPIHAPHEPRNRSFSVHLGKKVFRCFHPPCGAQGNVLDLWAAVQRLPLYEAACHLAATFDIPLLPPHGTEKRNP